jgi:putative Mg2+ transporter-C (MgtC) family protein
MNLSDIGYVETFTNQGIILFRLFLAAILGGLIGWERETHTAEAGLRTHILVAVAACLFTSLAFEIFHLADVFGQGQSDPIRAVEAVTAGIAFLGAGAIFHHKADVKGLTTGAGMWLAGAVGVSVALGFYAIALATSIMAVLVLAVLKTLKRHVWPKKHDLHGHLGDSDQKQM